MRERGRTNLRHDALDDDGSKSSRRLANSSAESDTTAPGRRVRRMRPRHPVPNPVVPETATLRARSSGSYPLAFFPPPALLTSSSDPATFPRRFHAARVRTRVRRRYRARVSPLSATTTASPSLSRCCYTICRDILLRVCSSFPENTLLACVIVLYVRPLALLREILRWIIYNEFSVIFAAVFSRWKPADNECNHFLVCAF